MKRIQNRFNNLAAMAKQIESSRRIKTEQRTGGESWIRGQQPRTYTSTSYNMDWKGYRQWSASVELLLNQVFGENSPHVINFNKTNLNHEYQDFEVRYPVFLAAKDDYENGYIFDVRSLVSAKVFSDELEQAEELIKKKHTTAAAVIAGTVLETTIRELAQQHGVDLGSVNKMNSDLAKEGVYNDAMKDQVQAWYKIRNNAAHGKPDEFTDSQVEVMIQGIRNFVADQMK
ncbi:DUF4145 domain-containing protein [Bremerella alba]|uniref:DUF4145 domain-containing protein n=1 Tax=Bremerella alba TaxID=980252 RepID=A0A7V8V813_9BACT|nr:DUF4145 domain-containing protein [Bremerella alba]MBA2116665.1 hypothetical protein [Bremerella alba]